jgi:hypothetical protein
LPLPARHASRFAADLHGTAYTCVDTSSADEAITTGATAQDVIPCVAVEHVVPVTSDESIVTGPALEPIPPAIARETVGTPIAPDSVPAGVPTQSVVSARPRDGIRAAQAEENIVSWCTFHGVVILIASDTGLMEATARRRLKRDDVEHDDPDSQDKPHSEKPWMHPTPSSCRASYPTHLSS